MILFYKLLGVLIFGGGVFYKIYENWVMINFYDLIVF